MTDDVRGELARMARGELLPHLSDLTRERIRTALEQAEVRDRAREKKAASDRPDRPGTWRRPRERTDR